MPRPCYVVDAFTGSPFDGNPAGVVLNADGLEEVTMQAIAAEFNLSETTFVLPPESPGARVRFRWFTPTTEVRMCGHATIGAVRALLDAGVLGFDSGETAVTVKIDTLSGTLTAWVEPMPGANDKQMIWLEMPRPRWEAYGTCVDALAPVLGLTPNALLSAPAPIRTQDEDVILFVKDFAALHEANPDFARLREHQLKEGMRGLSLVTVNTLTPTVAAQSRFFAPAAGIDEDPVTGSVHGPLAAYLADQNLVPMQDGTAGLQCVQSKSGGRTGVVYALVGRNEDDTYTVRIGGQAVVTVRGTIQV